MMKDDIRIRLLRASAAAILGVMGLISSLGGCIRNNKAVIGDEYRTVLPAPPGQVVALYGVRPIAPPKCGMPEYGVRPISDVDK